MPLDSAFRLTGMYSTDTTITAISSSPCGGIRQIIRITGPGSIAAVLCTWGTCKTGQIKPDKRSIVELPIEIDGRSYPAFLYIFPEAKSYTGTLLVEIHIQCPPPAAQAALVMLTDSGIKLAGPGEFTARAYLTGRIDLTQAEAVAEIISGTNLYQLNAAEKLLKGKLSKYISDITDNIVELISMLEAEMDFCDEGVMFITPESACQSLHKIIVSIKKLLHQNIRREAMIGIPSVGIAGLPNAGKSCLLNKLTESRRSIVSDKRATTRDILTARLKLPAGECVLFDCAGLSSDPPVNILDQMGQNAAIEALTSADIVIFCHDISAAAFDKSLELLKLFTPKQLIAAATKSELLDTAPLDARLRQLKGYIHEFPVIPISSLTGYNIDLLKQTMSAGLARITSASDGESVGATVNQRHHDSLNGSLELCSEAMTHIQSGSYELASLSLRQSHELLAGIEQHKTIDEKILDNIFSNFCIGK